MSKKVAGNTISPMTVQAAVDKAVGEMREKMQDLEAELRGARSEAAALRRDRDALRPLLRDALGAIEYLVQAECYVPGGEHHHGVKGTVHPVVDRLYAALPELQPKHAAQGPASPAAGEQAEDEQAPAEELTRG